MINDLDYYSTDSSNTDKSNLYNILYKLNDIVYMKKLKKTGKIKSASFKGEDLNSNNVYTINIKWYIEYEVIVNNEVYECKEEDLLGINHLKFKKWIKD